MHSMPYPIPALGSPTLLKTIFKVNTKARKNHAWAWFCNVLFFLSEQGLVYHFDDLRSPGIIIGIDQFLKECRVDPFRVILEKQRP